MLLQERTGEDSIGQMMFKAVSQGIQFGDGMIVTDGFTVCFSNMFLRVEFRRSRREEEKLQVWVGLQQVLHRLTQVPFSAVPQE